MTRLSLATARPLLFTAALSCASCASIDITRDTQTSGRFESTGAAFTILSIDLPKPALNIARDNAADARLTNMQVTDIVRRPDLGSWDWLLDILGVRFVRIEGTWGFTGAEAGNGQAGQ
ncbi:MAG: hypothetical protein FJ298_01840 [Planctomycetes bacterium]|nr:hypothetical protein [Planctomycetota bacterium]